MSLDHHCPGCGHVTSIEFGTERFACAGCFMVVEISGDHWQRIGDVAREVVRKSLHLDRPDVLERIGKLRREHGCL